MENSFPSEQKKKMNFQTFIRRNQIKKKNKQNKWHITGSDV